MRCSAAYVPEKHVSPRHGRWWLRTAVGAIIIGLTGLFLYSKPVVFTRAQYEAVQQGMTGAQVELILQTSPFARIDFAQLRQLASPYPKTKLSQESAEQEATGT